MKTRAQFQWPLHVEKNRLCFKLCTSCKITDRSRSTIIKFALYQKNCPVRSLFNLLQPSIRGAAQQKRYTSSSDCPSKMSTKFDRPYKFYITISNMQLVGATKIRDNISSTALTTVAILRPVTSGAKLRKILLITLIYNNGKLDNKNIQVQVNSTLH